MKFSIEKKYCIILNVMYDSEFVTVNVKGETIEELYKNFNAIYKNPYCISVNVFCITKNNKIIADYRQDEKHILITRENSYNLIWSVLLNASLEDTTEEESKKYVLRFYRLEYQSKKALKKDTKLQQKIDNWVNDADYNAIREQSYNSKEEAIEELRKYHTYITQSHALNKSKQHYYYVNGVVLFEEGKEEDVIINYSRFYIGAYGSNNMLLTDYMGSVKDAFDYLRKMSDAYITFE